jgi:hypothetical protein
MEHININLNDGAGNAMNMKISHQDLLVDGTTFGDPNTCYFGIFRSSLADTQSMSDQPYPTFWTLGSIILQKYYIVLDMSPYDE